MDTLNHLITKILIEFFTTRLAKTMEISRLEVPIEELENNNNRLKEEITGVPFEFIMNLSEIVQQDYADSELKTIIVPQNYKNSFEPYAIDRKGQRSTVLA